MISNSGSNENGKVYGGKAGDQTGREWQIRTWYNRPWNCVLRYPDAKVQKLIAEYAEQAANNNNVGYNQLKRGTFWAQLEKVGEPKKIKTPCDADCSAGVCGIVKAVGKKLGIKKLADLSPTLVTSQMRSAFKKAGFSVYTASKYLTSDKYLLRGDILLNDAHHVAINVTDGSATKSTPAATPAACPYKEPSYYIAWGSSGNGVKWVQWHLRHLGYDIGKSGVDGICGRMTDAAIRKFQKDKKLEVDGIVGPKTRAALKRS